MNMRVFSISAALSVVLCVADTRAEETVVNVGDVFTCYFQNKGDNKFADSKAERYLASDKDWSSQEMTAFMAALKTWDDAIENKPPRKLKVGVFWRQLNHGGHSGPLAVTRSALRSDPNAVGLTQAATVAEFLWRDGVDKCPPKSFDICIYFNTGAPYSSTEAVQKNAGGVSYDFQSVAVHELGHAFGFVSLARSNGQFGILPGGLHHTAFDALMVDAAGKRLIDKAFTAQDGVGFKPGQVIALKGSKLKVYNPSVWRPAASMVHVDLGKCVMSPFMFPGYVKRDFAPEEIRLLGLMGWQVKPDSATQKAEE